MNSKELSERIAMMVRDNNYVNGLTNEELIDRLIQRVWAKQKLDSHESNLLEIAVERIRKLDEIMEWFKNHDQNIEIHNGYVCLFCGEDNG